MSDTRPLADTLGEQYYVWRADGTGMRVKVEGMGNPTSCRPWYGYGLDDHTIKYESIDWGNTWLPVPDWTGFYEIPEKM